MNLSVRQVNRFFVLACAPFFGAFLCLLFINLHVTMPAATKLVWTSSPLPEAKDRMLQSIDAAAATASTVRDSVARVFEVYQQSSAGVASMYNETTLLAAMPGNVVDRRTTALLGTPIRAVSSANVDLKLFSLKEPTYNGYAMKVTLKTDKAMKLVLGKDKLGSSETTLEAANRYNAAAGVNAGGFADDQRTGKRYPLSTTMMGGKYVYGFEPTFENLFFVGINKDRKLIGGKFQKQQDLDRLNPMFGASFVPILLQNGHKQDIPYIWLTAPRRAPRTVIANYRNDQLLFLVTDGYDEQGNSGATLPELQDKLIALGAKDAYNLDGGGSSSLVWQGEVINRPSDGRLRPLATHFLFFK